MIIEFLTCYLIKNHGRQLKGCRFTLLLSSLLASQLLSTRLLPRLGRSQSQRLYGEMRQNNISLCKIAAAVSVSLKYFMSFQGFWRICQHWNCILTCSWFYRDLNERECLGKWQAVSAERGLFYQNTAGTSRLSPLISAIKHWCAQNRGRTWTDARIPTCRILFHLSVKADSFNTSHLLNSQINEERRQLSESVRLMKGGRLNDVAVFTTQVDLGRFHCCIWCKELFL